MELLLNDLSIHEQFHDAAGFRDAVERIIAIRDLVRKFGRELYCHWNLVNRKVSPNLSMGQGIQNLTREQQSALRIWFTRRGPFWDEARQHGPGDYLECDGDIVTDTAVGEAAYCAISGIDRQLVSFSPSSWQYSPVRVTLVADERTMAQVLNWWDKVKLANALQSIEPPITTWAQLETVSLARYQRLKFSSDAFHPLNGLPFSSTAAEYIKSRLQTLDDVMGCRDESGNFTRAAKPILDAHLTRGSAQFSDSSTQEKRDFRNELTFRHPNIPGEVLDCPWHGKVKPLLIRLHFRWPVPAGEDLYIVYIGRKITADN